MSLESPFESVKLNDARLLELELGGSQQRR